MKTGKYNRNKLQKVTSVNIKGHFFFCCIHSLHLVSSLKSLKSCLDSQSFVPSRVFGSYHGDIVFPVSFAFQKAGRY